MPKSRAWKDKTQSGNTKIKNPKWPKNLTIYSGTAEPEVIENVLEALEITTTELPPPHPPSCRKQDLFADASVL
jgi:hypothetical protein